MPAVTQAVEAIEQLLRLVVEQVGKEHDQAFVFDQRGELLQ